jgi:hypothetical protein
MRMAGIHPLNPPPIQSQNPPLRSFGPVCGRLTLRSLMRNSAERHVEVTACNDPLTKLRRNPTRPAAKPRHPTSKSHHQAQG